MAMEAVVCPQALLAHHAGTSTYLPSISMAPWNPELAELEEVGINKGLTLASECAAAGGGLPASREPCWWDFDDGGGRGTGWDPSCLSSPEAGATDGTAFPGGGGGSPLLGPAARCRRKRRRTKTCKNEEEVQNQRMTHIAVERNRRKQMNDYLAALRSLMPAFYVQRGDQASIVGGAINFVKELEQLLQSLEAQKRTKQHDAAGCGAGAAVLADHDGTRPLPEVQVTMVDSHANLKVLSRRRPQQLLRMVTGLQSLRLTTLHLSVVTTAVDQNVCYSFSLKAEDDCRLSSVEEIAAAVHHLLANIQEETACF